MTIEEIYERHVRGLPVAERLRLLELTARDLVTMTDAETEAHSRDIMELHGLGKELWEGIEPPEYVAALRAEWDHRP